jgi:hypothetical protein
LPTSCATKLWTMNTVPIGRITAEKLLIAPPVVAVSASSPSGATMYASLKPTTAWVARASTTGAANARSVRRVTVGAAVVDTSGAG